MKNWFRLFVLVMVFAPSIAHSAEQERLVVMQVQGPDLSSSERTIYRTAIVKALSDRYIVLSGDDVDAKVKEIFTKESRESISCDTEKCFQDIAMAFQAELIASCTILNADGGYLINLQINNVIENRSILAESEPCRKCKKFDVIDKLKEMASQGSGVTVTKSVELEKPIESTVLTSLGFENYKLSLNPLAGLRILDKGSWSPVDRQTAIGVDLRISKDNDPLFYLVGYSSSRGSNEGRTGSTSELCAGLGYSLERDSINYLVSAGLVSIKANFSNEESSSSGLLLRGAVFVNKYNNLLYGADFRMLRWTSVEFFGVNGDVNYYQAGLLLELEL